MTTATHRLSCIGNTRQWKEILKRRGWKWDAVSKNWYMLLVDAHANRITEKDDEFFRGLGGHLKGCQLILDGSIVWTSKTYSPPAADHDSPIPGDIWNCDASGNYAAGQRIPGSAPDDRI